MSLPDIDYIEIPAAWWDAEADKSLLIGVHKHGEERTRLHLGISVTRVFPPFDPACRLTGYERYNAMRADPDLCFLERVGMPDVAALSAEQGGGEAASDIADRWDKLWLMEESSIHSDNDASPSSASPPFSLLAVAAFTFGANTGVNKHNLSSLMFVCLLCNPPPPTHELFFTYKMIKTQTHSCRWVP